MVIAKKVRNILYPTLLVTFYLVCAFFYVTYEYQQGLLISINKITFQNIGIKVLNDFVSSLLPVIVLLIITSIEKKQLKDLGITAKEPLLVAILFLVYLVMFFVNNDFTMKGYYTAFFYLIIVAFSEEFIFRGYLFTSIERESGFWVAVLISGIPFGAAHSLIPAVLQSFTPLEFTASILSNILGQGIVGSLLFGFLYKKSNTLFVPVLIHAILDYSGVLFSK